MVIALAALLSAAWLLADDTVILQPSRSDIPGPSLDAGRMISQTFVAPTDGLEAVSLRLATYRQVVDGSVEVELWGPIGDGGIGPGPLIAEWTVDGPTIEDTLWRRLQLPSPVDGIAGRTLMISVVRPESGGNAPTVMLSEGDIYPAGAMSVDGAPVDGDLDFRLEFQAGRIGRAAYLLGQTGYPAAVAATLVVGLVAGALTFLYRSVPWRAAAWNSTALGGSRSVSFADRTDVSLDDRTDTSRDNRTDASHADRTDADRDDRSVASRDDHTDASLDSRDDLTEVDTGAPSDHASDASESQKGRQEPA